LAASKKKNTSLQAATAGVKLRLVNPRLVDGKLAGGTIYVLDDINFFGTGETVRRRMRAAASRDGGECIQDIPQDPGQAGKAQVQDLVAFLHGFRVRYSVESGDKVVRADPFSAQCEIGNVKLLRGAWNEAWLDEMTMFPNGRKDRCDASVRAYSRLVVEANRACSGIVSAPVGIANTFSYSPEGGAYQ